MGGGFGGKESQSTIIAALAALMAAKTRKPVKLRLSRDDDMVITGKRHDFLFRYQVGFDDNGRIEGIDILMACRAGNVADLSSSVLIRALCHADNAYYLPNAHIHGYPCKTNTVSNTGFRGFGGPQGMVAIETVIDHIARDLGKDPDDVRRANFYDKADRDTTHYGQKVEDNIIMEMVDSLSREIDYPARKKAVAAFNQENTVLKKGIALMPVKFGISFNLPTLNQAGALVHVYTDGSVHLNHGGTEMGQGLYTLKYRIRRQQRHRQAPTLTVWRHMMRRPRLKLAWRGLRRIILRSRKARSSFAIIGFMPAMTVSASQSLPS